MKLLVFSPYYPPHIGGLEMYAYDLNKHLSKKGMKVTVFTPHIPTNSRDIEIDANGTEIIRFPAFDIVTGYPLPRFWSLKYWKILFSLFGRDFDVITSHTRFFHTSLLALIFSKIKIIKWVHFEHGSDFVKSGGLFIRFMARLFDHTLGKIVLKSSDRNVAISKAVAKFSSSLAKNTSYEIIYRGIELDKIEKIAPNAALREKFKNKIIITFIGRLISGKGVHDLLEALGKLDDNFVLFIIGDGPEMKNLKNLSKKLALFDRSVFFGYKEFGEAIGILKISDIFVNPSYTEGLPTSVIEAALCRKPIIATDVGGTNEIISNGKSGLIIEPKNIKSLSKKISRLIQDPKLRESMGNTGYKEVTEKFNWDLAISKYLKIFNE